MNWRLVCPDGFGDIAADVVGNNNARQYGPETQELRGLLKQSYGTWIQTLASRDPAQVASLSSIHELRRVEGLQHKLKELSPRNAEQRELQCARQRQRKPTRARLQDLRIVATLDQ